MTELALFDPYDRISNDGIDFYQLEEYVARDRDVLQEFLRDRSDFEGRLNYVGWLSTRDFEIARMLIARVNTHRVVLTWTYDFVLNTYDLQWIHQCWQEVGADREGNRTFQRIRSLFFREGVVLLGIAD
jgi:hypothetical protein